MPVRVVDDQRLEAAARAAFDDDCRRSIGLDSADYVWPRVRPQYLRQLGLALIAGDRAGETLPR